MAEGAEASPLCYYTRNNILMRKWRPLDARPDEDWRAVEQIVLPKEYHREILHLAHDPLLAGNLGINKTYHRILQHFFWPGLKSDVKSFCKSCHTCQLVGKPNQNTPVAPLKPIPAVGEPFSQVLIDCVGPLPKSKSGNQYLLTIMCASTRFPEAIPLRNIKAKTIIKPLIKFFILVGLPKTVQSDQGSNFMAGVFQQVMQQLGIKRTYPVLITQNLREHLRGFIKLSKTCYVRIVLSKRKNGMNGYQWYCLLSERRYRSP